MEPSVNISGVKITGLEEIKSQLTNAALTRFPQDMAIALTKTAKDVQAAEIREMQTVFDRPTPWTLGGTYVTPATKDKLRAEVKLKDEWAVGSSGVPAAKYLWPEIFGGDRNLKRFESALRHAGVLPTTMYCVPGAAAERDQYGNIKAGLINVLIAWFRTTGGTGYGGKTTGERKEKLKRGTAKKRGYEYFAIRSRSGNLRPGIYIRTFFAFGSAIKPIIMFVKKPTYRQRFDFFGVGNKVADAMLERNLAIELNKTIDKLNAAKT